MQLPPYYHQESSYEIKNYLEDFIQNYHFISSKLWEPFNKTFPAIDDIRLPADDIILPADDIILPADDIMYLLMI
jgi:hypothetical protein